MPSTTRYRRGDIVLVPFPFTDLSSTKKRPALVVSPDKFNEHAQDVVLVAITSQPSARISDWLWYFCPCDQSSRLDCRGFLERNQATEGDTQWVNYKPRPFSSRSTGF